MIKRLVVSLGIILPIITVHSAFAACSSSATIENNNGEVKSICAGGTLKVMLNELLSGKQAYVCIGAGNDKKDQPVSIAVTAKSPGVVIIKRNASGTLSSGSCTPIRDPQTALLELGESATGDQEAPYVILKNTSSFEVNISPDLQY